MVCQRCRGLLVCETFDDLSSGTDSLYRATLHQLWVYRGAVVRANRFRRSENMRGSLRRRVRTGDVERITIPSEVYASLR